MKRLCALLLLLILLVPLMPVLPAAAQSPYMMGLRVGLWPEYDRDALLVIYWGTLLDSSVLPNSTVEYPATVRLRIPASVSGPHVVAAIPANDDLVTEVEYENTVDGDWRTISFETYGPQFQFEFYVPIEHDSNRRTMTYTWPGDYSVSLLTVELQMPPHATNLSTQPTLMDQGEADTGFSYYSSDFGPLSAGEELVLRVEYTRDEDALAVDMQSTLGTTSDTSTTGTGSAPAASVGTAASSDNLLLVVAVGIWAFLLGAFVMWAAMRWRYQREAEAQAKKGKGKPRR